MAFIISTSAVLSCVLACALTWAGDLSDTPECKIALTNRQIRKFLQRKPLINAYKLQISRAIFDVRPGRSWVAPEKGTVNLIGVESRYGIYGLYFFEQHRHRSREQYLVFLDILRRQGLNKLSPSQFALALHMDSLDREGPSVYWAFDLSKLKNPETQPFLTKAFRNIGSEFREFVFEVYRQRLKQLSAKKLTQLEHISIDMEDRTFLFLHTEESFIQIEENAIVFPTDTFPDDKTEIGGFPPETFRPMREKLGIKAAVAAVIARKGEKLPCEVFGSFQIPRKHEDEILVEIGRLAVPRDQNQMGVGPMLVQDIAAALQGLGISRIIAQVDAAHFKAFKQYNFRVLRETHDGPLGHEYLIEIDATAFLGRVLERYYDDYHRPDQDLEQFLNTPVLNVSFDDGD